MLISNLSTFQEYPKNVSEDGDGGAEDKDGEQERTDGICNFILRLKERKEVMETLKSEQRDIRWCFPQPLKCSGRNNKRTSCMMTEAFNI